MYFYTYSSYQPRECICEWLTRGGVQFLVMQWKRKVAPIEEQTHDLDLLATCTNKLT